MDRFQHPGTENSTDASRRLKSRSNDIHLPERDFAIVFLFALIGFIGAVYLYRTGGAPVLIAYFLATGVASLVYGFLGGIQGSSFGWGTLKLTGTAAVLVGIATLVNQSLKDQIPQISSPEGQYEWQWAGEGWSGYVDVDKSGAANIHMWQYKICGNVQTKLPIIQQQGAGKVEGVGYLTPRVQVSIPVKFARYDTNCNFVGFGELTVLEGTLEKTFAFAGKIEYHDKYGAPLGDMVLVKYLH